MTRRPQLKAAVSKKDFRDTIAEMASEFARHIELSVEAFAPDQAARKERLRRVAEADGFQFFMETYLPHYVRGEHSLFHQHIFARVPEILASEKGVRDLFVAPRGASKSTHLSLGFALYCIMRGLKRYIIVVCDVYEQAALLIEAIKAELTTNVRLQNDFPDAFGQGRLWREGEIVTRNNIRVEGLGAAKKIRGRRHGPYRPDLLFLDDIENDELVRSPEQRTSPMILIDKIDKFSGKAGSGGDPRAALLPLLQRSTAASFVCPYLQAPIDLSRVSWILCANTLDGLSRPLLDRSPSSKSPPLALPEPPPAEARGRREAARVGGAVMARPALQLLYASDRTAARLLDLKLAEFRDLVAAGALPPPTRIGALERWSVEDLDAILRGRAFRPQDDFTL